jgi:hypothetical protein
MGLNRMATVHETSTLTQITFHFNCSLEIYTRITLRKYNLKEWNASVVIIWQDINSANFIKTEQCLSKRSKEILFEVRISP